MSSAGKFSQKRTNNEQPVLLFAGETGKPLHPTPGVGRELAPNLAPRAPERTPRGQREKAVPGQQLSATR